MKIEKLNLNNLRNDAHFQFYTDILAQRKGRAAANKRKRRIEKGGIFELGATRTKDMECGYLRVVGKHGSAQMYK